MKRLIFLVLSLLVLVGCSKTEVSGLSEEQQAINDLSTMQVELLKEYPNSDLRYYKGTYRHELSSNWNDLLNDLRAGALNADTEMYQVYSTSYIDAGNITNTTIYRNYDDRSSLLTQSEHIVAKKLDVNDFDIYNYFVYDAQAIIADDAVPSKASDVYQLVSNDSQFEVLHSDHWKYRDGKLVAREYLNNGRYIIEDGEAVYIITRLMDSAMQIDVYTK